MNNISQCKITTKTFTLLPKSSITTMALFAEKIKRVTLFNNDWLKVALKFDKQTYRLTTEETHPLEHLLNFTSPVDDNDIKIFGSHTILIHSIGMFFIFTTLLLLLTICLMNFFHYIPEYFKPALTTNESSNSLAEQANDPLQSLNPFMNSETVAPTGE